MSSGGSFRQSCSPLREFALLAFLCTLTLAGPLEASERNDESLCFSEPLLAWHYKWIANSQMQEYLKDKDPAWLMNTSKKQILFRTSDNKLLRGYSLKPNQKEFTKPKGVVLVAIGSAMRAIVTIEALSYFTENGYEVNVYDYRGFGDSEGNTRFLSIISDLREIAEKFRLAYPKRYFYGISLGGTMLINALNDSDTFTGLVLDSPKEEIPCGGDEGEKLKPSHNLPIDSSKILLLASQSDQVVPLKEVQPLIELLHSRRGKTLTFKYLRHPLMDDALDRKCRFPVIMDFFEGRTDEYADRATCK
jgi:hypothetical protein